MTLFLSIAAALTAAALLFLLPPLLRRRTAAPDDRVAANAAIYREQLEELAADLQRGAIGREEFERASHEIERRIVAEHAASGPQAARHSPLFAAAIAIGLGLPLLAGLGYWKLGNPEGLQNVAAPSDEAHQLTGAQMEALVERLAERMEQKPDNADGWALLGRSLNSLGKHERASAAYAKAAQLLPQNADILADYADALAMAQGRNLEGEPLALVKRALAVDPNHIKALALAGTAEFERHNYPGAIAYWERILKVVPPDTEFTRSVVSSIAEARGLAGASGAPVKDAKPATAKAGATPAKTAETTKAAKAVKEPSTGVSLAGTVSLDPSLAAKAAPGDTVFILARPAEGSRMPLAIARVTVAQLPYRFNLDDSMAMAPGATISSHAQITVVARVSKAGSAAPQKGDIEGSIGPVAPGASGLKIVLSRILD
jgi:cytochrome c-type biogenesis protein CcmH